MWQLSECLLIQSGITALITAKMPEVLPTIAWCHQCKCQHCEKKVKLCLSVIMKILLILWTCWNNLRPPLVYGSHCKLLLQTTVSLSTILYLGICYILCYPIANQMYSKNILIDDASFLNLINIMWKGLWKVFSTVGWSTCSANGQLPVWPCYVTSLSINFPISKTR